MEVVVAVTLAVLCGCFASAVLGLFASDSPTSDFLEGSSGRRFSVSLGVYADLIWVSEGEWWR